MLRFIEIWREGYDFLRKAPKKYTAYKELTEKLHQRYGISLTPEKFQNRVQNFTKRYRSVNTVESQCQTSNILCLFEFNVWIFVFSNVSPSNLQVKIVYFDEHYKKYEQFIQFDNFCELKSSFFTKNCDFYTSKSN